MNTPRLQALADAIRALPERDWDPDPIGYFEPARIGEDRSAGGIAHRMATADPDFRERGPGPGDGSAAPYEVAAAWLGLPEAYGSRDAAVRDLFVPRSMSAHSERRAGEPGYVTRGMAAGAIDGLAMTGRIVWPGSAPELL